MTFYERRFTTLPARAPAGARLAREELMAYVLRCTIKYVHCSTALRRVARGQDSEH